ncbi:MAG: hypothetical protein AVDCRST_MAG32-791, partial [uncultured Nocardioides sp.]
ARRPRRDRVGARRPQLERAAAGAAGQPDRGTAAGGLPGDPSVPAAVRLARRFPAHLVPRPAAARGDHRGRDDVSGRDAPTPVPGPGQAAAREGRPPDDPPRAAPHPGAADGHRLPGRRRRRRQDGGRAARRRRRRGDARAAGAPADPRRLEARDAAGRL